MGGEAAAISMKTEGKEKIRRIYKFYENKVCILNLLVSSFCFIFLDLFRSGGGEVGK